MQLNVGSVYDGKVTGILKFGAFVELEKGTTGLVHISEVAQDYVNDINDFLKVGDSVKVKLLGIDGNKISLSIKRAAENQGGERKRAIRQPVFDGAKKSRPAGDMSFEDMMAQYMQRSDEKFSDMRRKNGGEPRRRSGRGGR